ncbi:MAG: SEC-C domain-containing protein [Gemmatimonadaceae bacterium]|nr:SEC-C domain-containing protein [Gemmatimonadaceae bacterium]
MDRNAPCPCGSGKKFKKCHGAALPPEAAALPAEARAEWLRGDRVLQRQKRVGQELLDWAEKKLTAEWIDASLDAWGLKDDEDIDEGVADLFTTWSLFNYEPTALGRPVAAAWLDDAVGMRADADTRALVSAALRAPLGLWAVETVEAGVGATITDRLSDTTCFVHEPDLTHDLAPTEVVLAYVVTVDGVQVFSGLHADTLLFMDSKPLLADVFADAGVVAAPLPDALQRDASWQLRLARRFSETALAHYPDDLSESDAAGEDPT